MPRRRPGHRRALAPAVLVGGAVACGGDPAAGAGDTGRLHTCDGVDASAAYVMRTLTFAPAPDGVGLGFDLDGHATVAGDAEGCGKADITDPDGAPGIDSAFAGLLPILEQTEAVAAETLVQDAINSGELLLTLQLTGLDDLEEDACVTAEVGLADGDPLLGSDGQLLDGQTLSRGDPTTWTEPIQGAVEDGVLTLSPLTATVKLRVITADIDLTLRDGMLRAEFDPETGLATGYFGGGFSTAELADNLEGQGVDPALMDLLVNGLPLMADLKDDAGLCTLMSVTFTFEAAPIFLMD